MEDGLLKMKTKTKIILLCICILTALVFVVVAPVYNKTKSRMVIDNKWYAGRLYLKADFEYKVLSKKIIVKNENYYNMSQLKIDVAFYNQYTNPENELTVELLLTEYDYFCTGSNSYDNLLQFIAYDNGGEDIEGDNSGAYINYCSDIDYYLKKTYSVRIQSATEEQLEKAIEAVNNGWTFIGQ